MPAYALTLLPRNLRLAEALRTMPSATTTRSADFEQLALPLFASLYNHAFWLTRNQAEAEDLVQETFSKHSAPSTDSTPPPHPTFASSLSATSTPLTSTISSPHWTRHRHPFRYRSEKPPDRLGSSRTSTIRSVELARGHDR